MVVVAIKRCPEWAQEPGQSYLIPRAYLVHVSGEDLPSIFFFTRVWGASESWGAPLAYTTVTCDGGTGVVCGDGACCDSRGNHIFRPKHVCLTARDIVAMCHYHNTPHRTIFKDGFLDNGEGVLNTPSDATMQTSRQKHVQSHNFR